MRFVFAGSSPYSLSILESCLASVPALELAGILTQPDRRGGRKMAETITSPLAVWARGTGVPVCKAASVRNNPEVEACIKNADFVLVASYGLMIPVEILAHTRLGWWNIHPSALPRHRGASPLHATILAGDTTSAVCLMLMESGLDTGAVLGSTGFDVPAGATVAELERITAPLAGVLVADAVAASQAGKLVVKPQRSDGITMTRKIRKDDGRISVMESVHSVLRKAAAYEGWPGVFVVSGRDRVQVLQLEPCTTEIQAAPGTVLSIDKESFDVQFLDGALRIQTLKRAGKSSTNGAAYCAGSRVKAGDRIWL